MSGNRNRHHSSPESTAILNALDTPTSQKTPPSGKRDLIKGTLATSLVMQAINQFGMLGSVSRKREMMKTIIQDLSDAMDLVDEVLDND